MPQGMAFGRQEAEASASHLGTPHEIGDLVGAHLAAVSTHAGAPDEIADFVGARAYRPPIAVPVPAPSAKPAPSGKVVSRRRLGQLCLECLPASVSWGLISLLIWGPVAAPLPLAVFVITFNLYWLWRSYDWCYHAVRGYLEMRRHASVDWRQRYGEATASGQEVLAWDRVHHIVLIPNYCEALATLRRTLRGLADSEAASKLFVALAMEEREGPPAREKAQQLQEEFQGSFAGLFATFHPGGIKGEVAGKSSNEAWAARWTKGYLVDYLSHDLDHLTVTSCDADTVFHPRYFSCLTHKFATDPRRYHRFWQAPIFYYNNIWDVPAPLRLLNAHSGLYFLAVFSRRWLRIIFPQSTYSLSLRMAHDAGYWDTDIVPEDWHMFLKCFFKLGGRADVDTIYLPLHMDAVRAPGYLKTFVSQYRQTRRHAWGCFDIPYSLRQCFAHREIPLRRRLQRIWVLWENHTLWATQWFFITIGWQLPYAVNRLLGLESLPSWFIMASTVIFIPTLVPLLGLVILDIRLRPPRPPHFRRRLLLFQYGCYLLMAPITFLFTALPALDAQTRLAVGRRMEYRVAEKG
ncbi:MAG TPA: hypothetical protein VJ256_00005 [Dehalococcoidia bacterium]|nr:hypothetical protein [Dehalococcoidia bacterium]